jgi:hypothetical protein
MVLIFAHCFTGHNYLNDHPKIYKTKTKTEKLANGEDIIIHIVALYHFNTNIDEFLRIFYIL